MLKQRIIKRNPHFWPKNPKANFQNATMNVSPFNTMNYEQITMNCEAKNKPNSKPIQTQCRLNGYASEYKIGNYGKIFT